MLSLLLLRILKVASSGFEEATGYDKDEFNNRMARQLPMQEKARQADYVIQNNGSLIDLQQTIKELYTLSIVK